MDGGGEIVGRARELQTLAESVRAVAQGQALALAVSGEAGIGKTQLLAAAAVEADASGFVTLSGRAAEFEADLPFGAFVDAIDDWLGAQPPSLLRSLGDEERALLSGIFPSVAAPAHSEGGLPSERFRAYQAVRSLLEAVGARRPVVLVLDDLHWADEGSLELVAHLLRRPPRRRVLVLMGVRTSPSPVRLTAALERATREGRCRHLKLQALGEADARRLLDGRVPAGAHERLIRESGGNPLFLEALAQAGADPKGDGAATVATDGVPPTIAAALARELDRLSARARRVARAASVVGDPFDLELTSAAAELGERDVLAGLDELLAADLARPTDVPRSFRFRHPIVRAAVYESAPLAWRVPAHERTAGALARMDGALAARAHHLERCAQPGDRAALAVLTEAAHANAQLAPASAARWFDAALRLLGEAEETRAQRLTLLVARSMALGTSGQFAQARDLLLEVIGLLPEEAGPMRADAVAFCAALEHLLGRHDEARALLTRTLEALGSAGGAEAPILACELASACLYDADYRGMRQWALRAAAGARALDDRPLIAAALALAALASYHASEIDEARRLADEAAAHVDGLEDADLARRLSACGYLGWAEFFLERLDPAIGHFERGHRVARRSGQEHVLMALLVGRASALLVAGRLAEAADAVDSAVEISQLAGIAQLEVWALTVAAWRALLVGDVGEALAAAERAAEGARASRDPATLVAFCMLAWAQLERRDAEDARDGLLRALGPGLDRLEPALRPRWFEVLANCELALGDTQAAQEWVVRAEAAMEGISLRLGRVETDRARAVVLLAAGRAREALTAALRARDGARGVGAPIDAARAQLLAGRALAALGQRDRAVDELRGAQATLRDGGAARLADEAARLLRDQGERVARGGSRGGSPNGLAALSDREREVAELVAQGRSNRQIAAELFISENTVETHLRRIFQKLGVARRAAVAGLLERQRTSA